MSRPAARAGLAGLTALVLVLLAACGLVWHPADSAPTAGPSSSARPTRPVPVPPAGAATSPPPAPAAGVPATLHRFYAQRLSWTDCHGGFQCAQLTVPLDYADPAGRTITVAVVRLPAADPAHRIGSLVVNPGGPGGSGIEFAESAPLGFGAALLRRFDIVGFDPRGVGQSTPIECLSTAQLDAFTSADASPDDAAEVRRLADLSKGLAQACERRSGWLLPHVGTVDVARDMDVLRGALGDRKLDYLGKSYGTLLGATYAELFPQRVGRMVLDGALDPALSAEQIALGQADGFRAALTAFLTDCVSRPGCPLGTTVDAARARLARFLADVDARPLAGTGGRQLTQGLALLGVVLPLYVHQYWPLLRLALAAGLRGSGGPLLGLADQYLQRGPTGYRSNGNQVIYAVNCIDRQDLRSVGQAEREQPAFEQASPIFGAAILWGALPCAYWPAGPVDEPHEIHAPGAAPVLVVGTTRDPATPYAWAVSLAHQLDSGVLLTRVGDGHTAYRMGSSCIDRAVETYLTTGMPPKDGTRC